MIEKILTFGSDNRLSGILRCGGGSAETGFLLFNAGVIHRVGPHRLNINLARGLGAPTLRFDLSGQGESAAAPAGLGFEAQAIDDIAAAIDALKVETGVSKIIAIGLCSGADHALRAAVQNPQLDGLVLLDPYAYPNDAAARAEFKARATDPDRWSRKIRFLVEDCKNKKPGNDADPVEDYEQGRPVPEKPVFAGDLSAIVERGGRILIVYTGLVRHCVSKPAHFFDTFSGYDFFGRIDVCAMPHVDHMFTARSAQEALLAQINDWARSIEAVWSFSEAS